MESLRLAKVTGEQALLDRLAEMEKGIYKDSKGRILRTNYTDGAGKLTGYGIYDRFDEKGYGLHLSEYDQSGTLTGSTDFLYAGEAYTDQINYDAKGGEISRYTYSYDEKGNQIRQTGHSADGSLLEDTAFSYDGQNRRIRGTSYDENGSVRNTMTFLYDDQNRIVRRDHYSSSGNLTQYVLWDYSAGDTITRTTYDSGGKVKDAVTYQK